MSRRTRRTSRGMSPAKTTWRTVLKPAERDARSGKVIRDYRGMELTDYIAVPRVATFGTFRLEEMVYAFPGRR